MANKKVVSVLSTAAIGTLIASAVGTTALAKVDGLVVKNAEGTYLNYDLTELQESAVENYLGNEEGAVLYKSFDAARANLVSYHDDKTGFIDANAIAEAAKDAILNGEEFDVNKFTEASKETALPGTVYQAVVKDGVVVKGEEVKPNGDNDEDEDLKVVSVESINAAQVKVTFNRALTEDEKDEAEDLANYTLENKKGNEIEDVFADVEVKEGSKEAILTVDYSKVGDNDDDLFENQYSYTLIIDENVTGKEVTKEFKVSDFDIPEVTSVEVVGIRTIKVKVSEPIVAPSDDYKNDPDESKLYAKMEDAFEINDGDYSIDKVVPIDNGREFNIILLSDLEDGEDITVDVKSKAEDYAGYSLKKASFNTKVDVNKEALEIVGYEKAKEREITLVFNKDIRFADYEDDYDIAEGDNVDSKFFDNFYHTTSKNKAERVKIDGNKLTLYFSSDNQLPETAYVYVDADVLEDLWNKENDDLFIKVTINKDNVKPEIKKVEQADDSNRIIEITFSEELDKDTAEDKDNYTIKDKDGKEVRISGKPVLDDKEKKVTITLSKDLEDGEEYSVTVEDVEDKAGNKIAKVTKKFTAKNTEAVDNITAKYYDAGRPSQKIVVDFDGTKMLADGSRYAINNLENYDLTIGSKTINLSDYDGASIKAVNNGTKAEIKLPGNNADDDDRFDFTGKTLSLRINKVEDANGNKTDIMNVDVHNGSESGSIEIDGDVEAVDRETIKVVFDDEITLDKGDISLVYDGGTLTPSSTKVEKANGKTTVTYKLKESEQLDYSGEYEGNQVYLVVNSKAKSKNSYGDTLKADTKEVKDKIAPELAKIDNNVVVKNTKIDDRDDYDDAVRVVKYNASTNTATIELIFEENIQNAVTKSMFETDDSDVDVVYASAEDNILTLELQADSADYKEAKDFLGLRINSKGNNIFDKAGNGAPVDTEIQFVPVALRGKEAVKDKVVDLAKGNITATAGDNNTITATVKDGKENVLLKDIVSLKDLINVGGMEVANVTINGTSYTTDSTLGQIEEALAKYVEVSSFNEIKLSDLQGKEVSITYVNGDGTITYTLAVAPAAQQ
ncbi:Ig-like domain-containing protein [Clostridium colicanis]|uniref:Outer cell wall protein n=1 Tax=Clostridium colicanis DSM 13634 TaxID=1121305 RepID=A0A151AKD9_9CLOT|nr:Ig-like domain-containing protein [Clostridium colicanis]KYH28000.1 outer cell wall protein precursor [Clostridium colicanis DSM 13634]